MDDLVAKYVGTRAEEAFVSDLSNGLFRIEWGSAENVQRGDELNQQYRDLKLGLVDAVVMAIAERTKADAIATVDERHFGAIALRGSPRLLPRDL